VLADLVQFLHVCADQSHHEKEGQCCCLGLRISACLALKWSDVDWINGKLTVERGIVCQQVDDVKTTGHEKALRSVQNCWRLLKLGNRRPSSLFRRIGSVRRQSSLADCLGLTIKSGAPIRKQQARQVSAGGHDCGAMHSLSTRNDCTAGRPT
jgi:hypothetical protein